MRAVAEWILTNDKTIRAVAECILTNEKTMREVAECIRYLEMNFVIVFSRG